MKFLIDEDVAIEVVRFLRRSGHQVEEVFDVLGSATPDPAIWQHAVQTGAIVITCNRDDFLKLAGEDPATGLIVLNRRRTRQSECNHISALLARAGETGLAFNINFA